MRAFIALEIPEEIREKLFEIAGSLFKKILFLGKLTEKENIHLTLKFLGEIDGDMAEKVREKLGEVNIKKFFVELKNFGVFNENFVRIIWCHLSGCEKLQKEIDEKLAFLFPKEKRFMGHVTIARVKNVIDKEKLFEELKRISVDGVFEVERFVLMKSELTGSGPSYGIVEEYSLY